LVRVDVHGTQARYSLLPGLPRFRQQYPDIRLHLGEAHQPLDTVREGFDCILRAGELSDNPLIKRRLALLERGTFASPDYLCRFGKPRTPDDLGGHEMVGLLSPDSGDIVPLVFGRRQRAPGEIAGDSEGDRSRGQCRVRLHGPRV
jgi:DNA-binding transcriptional LysR family regulator